MNTRALRNLRRSYSNVAENNRLPQLREKFSAKASAVDRVLEMVKIFNDPDVILKIVEEEMTLLDNEVFDEENRLRISGLKAGFDAACNLLKGNEERY